MTFETLQLNLLGELTLLGDGSPVVVPSAVERVVALVALSTGNPTRSKVAGTLWPASSQDQAMASLRTVIWRARTVAEGLIETTGRHLGLGASVTTDVSDLERELDSIERDDDYVPTSPSRLSQQLLASWDEPWLDDIRLPMQQIQVLSLCELQARFTRRNDHRRSLEAAAHAVRLDPWSEMACCAQIEASLAAGDRVGAVRYYRRYMNLVGSEIGFHPSSRLHQLASSIERELRTPSAGPGSAVRGLRPGLGR